ncbi:MAG: ABC transporter substrate-binding protein [Nannocystaceae bacterium]|nr:ABC transporter substrate-binding protein [Nannocystaceae bacterium]
MRSQSKILALSLFLFPGCSLDLPEQEACASDMQCADAFGPGASCQPDGFCLAANENIDGVGVLVDGVSASTIRTVGIATQTGTAGPIGVAYTVGIQAALAATTPDERGGYDLQHFARDDGYVPDTSVALIQEVTSDNDERDDPYTDGGADAISGREAFAVIGSVGSPTSAAMLDTINEVQIPFFGTYSGAPHLYNTPPDRVVWQFRPEYENESYKLTEYLVSVRDPERVPVTNIFVLSQSPVMGTPCDQCESDGEGTGGQAAAAAADDQTVLDAYGFAGYRGVRTALQEHGISQVDIPLGTYRANSTDLGVAVTFFSQWVTGIAQGAHAPELDEDGNIQIGVVMIPVGAAGAEFVQRVLDEVDQLHQGQRPSRLTDAEWESVDPDWKEALSTAKVVFTSISPAGDGLAKTLGTSNPERLCGTFPIIVSQVVPFPLGNSGAAIRFREELAAYDETQQPGFANFEGWVIGKVWAEVVRRAALSGDVTADSVITVLETNFDSVDVNVGSVISYNQNDHLGSEQVFATRLDATCAHEDFSLEVGG